jgi:hypothetical protein
MPDKASQQHDHQRVEVRSDCPDCGQELSRHTFNRADLEQQQLSELPNREAMSLVNANLALAANVLSDGSIAAAGAQQNTPISQGMLTQPPTTAL